MAMDKQVEDWVKRLRKDRVIMKLMKPLREKEARKEVLGILADAKEYGLILTPEQEKKFADEFVAVALKSQSNRTLRVTWEAIKPHSMPGIVPENTVVRWTITALKSYSGRVQTYIERVG
jgi:hypothetical protein